MNAHRLVTLLCSLYLLGASASLSAGETWRTDAERIALNSKDVKQLAHDKVLVTQETFKQVFDPYVTSRLPVFITSDSLLNGFHILYEESILRMERARARKLPEILVFVWNGLSNAAERCQGDTQLVARAKVRAQVVIGTAITLLGDESIKPDTEVGKLIRAEAERVATATGQDKPAWLGPPDNGFIALDYSRYKPRGFYEKSTELQRYFRAVSWLQSIPFRGERNEELLAIFLMGDSLRYDKFQDDPVRIEQYYQFFRGYAEFVGAAEDLDIITAAQNTHGRLTTTRIVEKRLELLTTAKRADDSLVNDQIRLPPSSGGLPEVTFRVIAPYRVPDAALFQRMADRPEFKQQFPSGLEVCAVLGSPFAREQISAKDGAALLKTIDEAQALFAGTSLYQKYLHCLAALFEPPPSDAPPFMARESWRIKSCQTCLAAWAQLRHTWTLQAKQSVQYLSSQETSPGFVEPNPEFFSRMGQLAEDTEEALRRAGAFTSDTEGYAVNFREAAEILKRIDFTGKGDKAMEEMSDEERMLVESSMEIISYLDISADTKDRARYFTECTDKLTKLADELDNGRTPANPKLAAVLPLLRIDIEPLWHRLALLCRRLEALANKQLRTAQFSDEEKRFLEGYGEHLAAVMLYGGNSYDTPRDDAPRVVDVFSNPNISKYLEVGVGRARALYVLYPWKDGEVLCRGAVMPYYEFANPRRLTDAEWKALLDTKECPPPPEWLIPIAGRTQKKAVSETAP